MRDRIGRQGATRKAAKGRPNSRAVGCSALLPSDLALLESTALFAGISREAIQACLVEARVQVYSRDTRLFSRDDPAACFFIVLDGWIKLFRDTPDGGQTVFGAFSRGQPFALAAAFRFGVYPVNADIVEHSRLLAIPAANFVQRARANAVLAMNINATMGDLMQSFVAQIERLTTLSATERVADFLVSHCSAETGPVSLHLPHDKALIAARLGMEPETFSRCLAKLRAHGVESSGAVVRIGDVDVLRKIGAHAPD